MRVHCAFCGKRLTPTQKRHCSAECRKREGEYQRAYQREHKRDYTEEQREAARQRSRERRRKQQELRNKPKPEAQPKEKPVSLHRMYPHPWWRGGECMGFAIGDWSTGYE